MWSDFILNKDEVIINKNWGYPNVENQNGKNFIN